MQAGSATAACAAVGDAVGAQGRWMVAFAARVPFKRFPKGKDRGHLRSAEGGPSLFLGLVRRKRHEVCAPQELLHPL